MVPAVTVRQRELVQSTWKRVVPISKTAPKLFYARLFELDPQLRALFPAEERSMKAQHFKLMQMIAICVRGLDHLDRIVPAVQNLGRRHVGYGVRNSDYDAVGAALLWTLEQGLGEFFDDEVKEAWANVYGVLAGVMTGAANEAPQRSCYVAGEDGPVEAVHRPGYARPQVDLRETGLNVLAKVDGNGIIYEANEGMEVVTGMPNDELRGTDAFSYFIEPNRVKGWFMEALQGSSVRDKEVEVIHQEGEITPLTYSVSVTSGNGQTGGVLLCRYREG